MITLDVKDYCASCMDFSPDVERPLIIHSSDLGEVVLSNTVVRCEYRERCEAMKRYLEKRNDPKGE